MAGFEFMDEAATDEQKDIIRGIAGELGIALNDQWPEPFSRWDAAQMIESLREQLLIKETT